MISPEVLRRFPFFNHLNPQHLNQIAMISEQFDINPGDILFEECQPATALFLLVDGLVDLSYQIQTNAKPQAAKQVSVGDVNPGEIFSISSLIEPYKLNATATCTQSGSVIKIDALKLRAMMDEDTRLGYIIMKQVIKATMERLAATRIQLAAAWA